MSGAAAEGSGLPAVPDAPRAFHLLAKPTGAVCNLDCSYCFFLSKEMLYPGSRFRMADELLETYLQQLIEAHGQVDEVAIAWQGGEPTLMGLDFFRRSVELAQGFLQPGQRAAYTIQTNGTLLDEEWAAFFKEHDFLVGISIDGPREIHDAYRVDKGGRGSFDQVMRGLGFLRAAGVEWNALTTVHAANGEHGREVYRFLRDECGAGFVQFIPIIERVAETTGDGTVPWTSWRDRPLYVQEGDVVTGRSIGGEQYGRFLDRRVRGVGAPRRRRGLRADVRRRARKLGRRAAGPVHPLARRAGSRSRSSTPATSTPATTSSSRSYLLGNIQMTSMLELVSSPQAAAVRARQARHPAALLPRVRRPLRLPRRLPQGPLHLHPRRRARAQLPLPRLQALLPPRRPADADHGRAAETWPRPRRDHGALLSWRCRTRPQRPVHLRLRAEMEALPRRSRRDRPFTELMDIKGAACARLSAVPRLMLLVTALAVSATSVAVLHPGSGGAAASPGWSGSASCTITVSGPGYQHSETQRWQVSGPKTVRGAFQFVPSHWSDTGSGASQVTQGDQTRNIIWTVKAAAAGKFQFIVRASDNKLAIGQANAQLRVQNGITGTQQVTIGGVAQTPGPVGLEAFETQLPPIVTTRTSRSVSGSTPPTPVKGSVAPFQPAAAAVTKRCAWRFVRA